MADQLVFRSAGRGAPSQPGDVLRMILKRGMTLAAIGVPAGLAISFLITRFIATLLYGVTPFDAVTFCAMSLVLLAVAFVASMAPACRAAETDPMTTLRTQ